MSDNPDRPSLSDLSLVLLNRYEGAKALLAKRLREASQQTKLTTYLTLCVCWWTSSTMTCVSFAALIFISAPNALFNTARWLVIASIAAGLVALAIPWVGFPSLTQEERHRARIRTELLCGVIEIYCVMFAVSLLDTPLDRSDTRSFANMAQHWPTIAQPLVHLVNRMFGLLLRLDRPFEAIGATWTFLTIVSLALGAFSVVSARKLALPAEDESDTQTKRQRPSSSISRASDVEGRAASSTVRISRPKKRKRKRR